MKKKNGRQHWVWPRPDGFAAFNKKLSCSPAILNLYPNAGPAPSGNSYMIRFILVILVSELFISCDPGFSVILSNQSQIDRHISIIGINGDKLQLMGSVYVADTSSAGFFENAAPKKSVSIIKDSTNLSFFVLEKGKKALLQSGMGKPDLNQNLIIDGRDTVLLRNDQRTVIKRKPFYTYVTVTIK